MLNLDCFQVNVSICNLLSFYVLLNGNRIKKINFVNLHYVTIRKKNFYRPKTWSVIILKIGHCDFLFVMQTVIPLNIVQTHQEY